MAKDAVGRGGHDGSSGVRGDEGSRIATGVCPKRSVSLEVDNIGKRCRIYYDVTTIHENHSK